jgi:hypothetical protein
MENFKPEKRNSNQEKEALWNKIALQAEYIRDGLGKGIDAGIKETVISFMVNGIVTKGSCEGHLDRGRLYPYIHIDSSPKEELRNRSQLLRKRMEENGYSDIESVPITDKDLYEEIQTILNEYNIYKEEINSKIKLLLENFYSHHQPITNESMLTVWKGGAFFEVSPVSGAGVGLENWEKFKQKEKEMSLEERKAYLENSQAEMKSFTGFLKDRFFNDNEV